MISFKLLVVLNEGLIFGLISIGIYVSFQWLRYPDLTPDGSFVTGAVAYAIATGSGYPPLIALFFSIVAGTIAGLCTGLINRLVKIPSVVAALLVASGMYSVNWLLLGKPNQFLTEQQTLVGNLPGIDGALALLFWLIGLVIAIGILLSFFAHTVWGLRARAIGENPLLAQDVGTSLTGYTVLCLAMANGIVGLAGALFTQRSYSADINMGIGITITGLTGMIMGLLIARGTQKIGLVLLAILAGSILYRGLVFLVLGFGVPGQSFRLISATVLIIAFALMRESATDFMRGIKWN